MKNGEDRMTKRYFKREWEEEYYIFDSQTISEKEFDEKLEYEDYKAFEDSMQGDEVVNRLNELSDKNEQLKKRASKIQSKYDKNKTDELHILVETDNTVLLDKKEFEAYARRNNELKKRNKKRKEKNRNYRNELRKRLKEISGLKEFIAEDLSKEDKVLKGFIEEYL